MRLLCTWSAAKVLMYLLMRGSHILSEGSSLLGLKGSHNFCKPWNCGGRNTLKRKRQLASSVFMFSFQGKIALFLHSHIDFKFIFEEQKRAGLNSKNNSIHSNFLNILKRKLTSCIYLLKTDLTAKTCFQTSQFPTATLHLNSMFF